MALIDNAARSFALGYLMGLRVVDVRVLNRPDFMDTKNLQPFVDEALEGVLKTIDYG